MIKWQNLITYWMSYRVFERIQVSGWHDKLVGLNLFAFAVDFILYLINLGMANASCRLF